MKQLSFTVILISAFCFVTVAQTSENVCPQFKFVSPNQNLFPDKSITFVARVGENREKGTLNYEKK